MNTASDKSTIAWLDPTCEAVDSLHLPDADWRRENNWCNAPGPRLPDLMQKLQQSGAAATVVAPRWEGKAWHHALTDMAVEELTLYLSAVNNFFKDHGREPMAQGDLVSRVRKGLAASQVFAGGRVLAARWAISQREGQAKWTADTLTSCLQLGTTTAAYVIGVTMQKIKYFGGWAMHRVQRASS
eukprot:jgi/Tetstr1/437429/TSEL_026110.t1